jgi:hypothetical protein
VAFLLSRDALARRRAATASEHWTRTTATILESRVVLGTGRQSPSAVVRYSYVPNGDTIVGHRLAFQYVTAQRPGAARAMADAFPVGARVPVFYDPRDPR